MPIAVWVRHFPSNGLLKKSFSTPIFPRKTMVISTTIKTTNRMKRCLGVRGVNKIRFLGLALLRVAFKSVILCIILF
jgi:hypothetical protein